MFEFSPAGETAGHHCPSTARMTSASRRFWHSLVCDSQVIGPRAWLPWLGRKEELLRARKRYSGQCYGKFGVAQRRSTSLARKNNMFILTSFIERFRRQSATA